MSLICFYLKFLHFPAFYADGFVRMFRAEDGAPGREPQGAGSRAEFVRGIILAPGLLSGCSFFLARAVLFVRLPPLLPP